MRLHIEKAYKFIETYLPENYSRETQQILFKSKIEVTADVIRNVRTKKTTTIIP